MRIHLFLLFLLPLLLLACGQPSEGTGGGGTASTEPAGDEAPAASAEPVVVFARIPNETPGLNQQPVLPQPSPRAAVEQTVGIARVRVDYSSPATKNRQIWGGLVPYGQLWRAGANAPTRLEISEPATIFGAAVPAGSYTIFVRPEAAQWTVILNRDPELKGYQHHDAAHDVASGTVTPADAPPRERLAYTFDDTTETSTKLVLDWAGKRAVIPIEFDTNALAQARIDATLAQAWRPHFNAGRYYLEQDGQEQRAVELLTRSNQIQSTWWNEWFLARALAEVNRKPEAITHAERALELGANDEVFTQNFQAQVRAALEEWR